MIWWWGYNYKQSLKSIYFKIHLILVLGTKLSPPFIIIDILLLCHLCTFWIPDVYLVYIHVLKSLGKYSHVIDVSYILMILRNSWLYIFWCLAQSNSSINNILKSHYPLSIWNMWKRILASHTLLNHIHNYNICLKI